jgi:hypothetical protein
MVTGLEAVSIGMEDRTTPLAPVLEDATSSAQGDDEASPSRQGTYAQIPLPKFNYINIDINYIDTKMHFINRKSNGQTNQYMPVLLEFDGDRASALHVVQCGGGG